MSGTEPRLPTGFRAIVYTCVLLSGAAGLAYEIVWLRMLGLVFGHTVFALTAVLVAFMAGLAVGASLLGRWIDRRGRPLRVYGFLEVGIGLSALLVPPLLSGAQVVHLALYPALGASFFAFEVLQLTLVLAILLVPTTLMGGTLPVLSKLLVDRVDHLGRRVADLYALNTFGAVLGSATAGFVLLPALGARTTTLLAVAVNLAVGAIAVAGDRLGRPAQVPEEPQRQRPLTPPPPDEPIVPVALVLAGVGLAGAAAMTYEVAWTRALRLVLGSSTYAFAAMLTTFLVGLALGSALFARLWGTRRAGAAAFGALLLAAAGTAVSLVPAFERLPDVVLAILARTTPSATGALVTQFAVSFLAMIVPTTIMGAIFPCAAQIWARTLARLGRDVGLVYSVNTTGNIAGALLAGLVLIPWIGTQASMLMASAATAVAGAAVLAAAGGPAWRRGAGLSVLLLVATVALLPRWEPRVMTGGVSIYAPRFTGALDAAGEFRDAAAATRLLYYREGLNATVSVERSARMTVLKIDGKMDASNGPDMPTQLLSGHLPLLLGPRAEGVLVIGLGSGVTVGAVAQHPGVSRIDVVELEPAVIEAERFFQAVNRNALDDPRVRVVVADGRTFILASDRRYDVIISEPSNPWLAGVGNLFSREFYELVRGRLAEDGMVVQWVQAYNLAPREFRMILNTFRRVFPHATLWRTLAGDYLLVGGPAPLAIDYRELERRISAAPTVGEDLSTVGLTSPLDLLTLFVLDEADLARVAAGAAENTDDRPLLEFAAPLALYEETTEQNARLLREARTTDLPPLRNLAPGLLEARALHWARVYWAAGETQRALDQLRRSPRPDPQDVEASLARAKLLFAIGELGAAVEGFEGLARQRPGDPLVASYVRVGRILRERQAEETFARASKPGLSFLNLAEAHSNLGVFYTRLGIRFREPAFFDLAADSLEAAVQIEPHGHPALNNLANVYFEQGRLDDAVRLYERVLALVPEMAEIHFNLGLVHERQGAHAAAMERYRVALERRPGWDAPRQRLERLRSRAPEGEGARAR